MNELNRKKKTLPDTRELRAAQELVSRGDWLETYRQAAEDANVIEAIAEHNRRVRKRVKKEQKIKEGGA